MKSIYHRHGKKFTTRDAEYDSYSLSASGQGEKKAGDPSWDTLTLTAKGIKDDVDVSLSLRFSRDDATKIVDYFSRILAETK
jgi:hypothetical protein